jgi:putative ABC transport system permease protein
MWKNHFKVALRSTLRHKGYAAINVAGLAVGIACCTMILLWVMFEFSYDNFHRNGDRIYRVAETTHEQTGFHRRRVATGTPLGPILASECPSVETTTRIYKTSGIISAAGHGFSEDALLFADSTIFSIFDFALAGGDKNTALDRPGNVLVTPEIAKKYFGDVDPIGKTLLYDGVTNLMVTGVLAPMPRNSHIRADLIVSMSTITASNEGFARHWDSPVLTYVLLRPGTAPQQLEAQFPSIISKYRGSERTEEVSLSLQPLSTIHLQSNMGGELEQKTDVARLYQFAVLALFILLVASVNFVNLSTAQAVRRSREVGMRKALGAGRLDLIKQYLCESIMVAALATLLALALVELIGPAFSSLVGAPVDYSAVPTLALVLGIVAVPVIVGTLAGLFPALYLSAAQPTEAIKGTIVKGKGRTLLRKALVIVQFAIAAVLVICTLVGFSQLSYLMNKDLGFVHRNLLVVSLSSPEARKNREVLKGVFDRNENVRSVTAASNIPGEQDCHGLLFKRPDGSGYISMPVVWTDKDYPQTLCLRMSIGVGFDSLSTSGTGAALMNESAARTMEVTDPLGMQLFSYVGGGKSYELMHQSRVAGVVKDFNFRDLSYRMQPLILIDDPSRTRQLLVRVREGTAVTVLRDLEREWKSILPDVPFVATRLDDVLAANYGDVNHFATVLTYSSLLAILIASIGLLGLSSFVIVQRTKELAIRRILGASTAAIVRLLTREFVISAALASVVAWPIAYYLLRWWLNGFTHRIDLGISVFLVTSLAMTMLAFITVGSQAIRAARTNPIESVRYE